MIAEIGLIVIVFAWLLQFFHQVEGSHIIRRRFIFLYIVGVLLLVTDAYINNLDSIVILNLIIVIVSALVLLRVHQSKQVKTKKRR
jgi:membrane-bound ClpP family serine protease